MTQVTLPNQTSRRREPVTFTAFVFYCVVFIVFINRDINEDRFHPARLKKWRWVMMSCRIGRVFTGNNLFFFSVDRSQEKKYRLHLNGAGRTLHCRKQALRSWTWFVISHKCTLPLVESKTKDDSRQSDFFALARWPLPVAFMPLLSLKCIFRCHGGVVHVFLIPYSGQLSLSVVRYTEMKQWRAR